MFLYVILMHDTTGTPIFFKVGKSNNPPARLAQLQSANPYPLSLVATAKHGSEGILTKEKRVMNSLDGRAAQHKERQANHKVKPTGNYQLSEWFHYSQERFEKALQLIQNA